MKEERSALDFFHEGYSCAQSVFAANASRMGLETETALRLAAGLGAGIGRMRLTCGAFCALVLTAGYCRGNTTGSAEDKERIYALVQRLAEEFRAEFGTLSCAELLHIDPATESTRPQERTTAYYSSRPCERCVAFCDIAAKRLLEETVGERITRQHK